MRRDRLKAALDKARHKLGRQADAYAAMEERYEQLTEELAELDERMHEAWDAKHASRHLCAYLRGLLGAPEKRDGEAA